MSSTLYANVASLTTKYNNVYSRFCNDISNENAHQDCYMGECTPAICGTESKVERLRHLFREKAGLLYNDIVDAVKCTQLAHAAVDVLIARHQSFCKEAGILAEFVPNMAGEIDFRLKLAEFQLNALTQCNSSRNTDSGISSHEEESDYSINNLKKFRLWLKRMATAVNYYGFHENFGKLEGKFEINRHLQKQKDLQTKIQLEGGALLSQVRRQLRSTTKSNRRKLLILTSLENRWHALWITCLEWQCKFEQLLKLLDQNLDRYTDTDNDDNEINIILEPAVKRQRLDCDNDIIFANNNTDDTNSSYSDYENEYDDSKRMDLRDPPKEFLRHTAGNGIPSPTVSFLFNATDSDVEYCNDKGKLVYNRSAMAGDNEAVLKLKENGAWNRNDIEIVGQDVGYSSENSIHSSNDGNLSASSATTVQDNNDVATDALAIGDNSPVDVAALTGSGWSATSSPCLQIRSRIQKSPIKRFYKMTPLDSDGATDTETPRSVRSADRGISDDALYVYTQKSRSSDNSKEKDEQRNFVTTVATSTDDYFDIIQMLEENNSENDPFQQELTRFVREGTTWKPFINGNYYQQSSVVNARRFDNSGGDASSEMSLDESDHGQQQHFVQHQLANRGVMSVPPNSPLDPPAKDILFRRRRKRSERPQSLVFRFPPFKPMTASTTTTTTTAPSTPFYAPLKTQLSSHVTNRFASAYCTLPRSTSSSLEARRRKLKRLPRSMSDGEHLTCLNLNVYRLVENDVDDNNAIYKDEKSGGEESPDQSPPDVPPCTPRNSTASSSSETERDEEDAANYEDGGGESMILEEDRVGGDGDSPSTEQSDIVWEWDDYKPLNHKENGFMENPMDGTCVTEFGEDYLMHLDSLAGPLSARSTNSDNDVTVGPILPRLPPVGLSQDSDSELEELCQIIKESQKHYRSSQQSLRQHGVIQQSSWAELMKTAIKNVLCLQNILRQIANLNRKTTTNESEYSTVSNQISTVLIGKLLLGERNCGWGPFRFYIKYVYSSTERNGLHPLNNDLALLKQWQDMIKELQCKQPVKDDAWFALQSVMQRLGKSLNGIMNHLSSRNTSPCPTTYPVEVLVTEMDMLKELTSKLKDDRKELDQWICGNTFIGQYCPELQQLAKGYALAVDRCSTQLKQLENLHAQWLSWHETEDVCKQLLNNIKQKLQDCSETENRNTKSIQLINEDLELCQDRLNRLETVCNGLTTVSNLIDENQYLDVKRQLNAHCQHLESLKVEFERLPKTLDTVVNRNGSVSIDDSRLVDEKVSNRSDTDEQEGISSTKSGSAFVRFLLYSWPIHLILILLFCFCLYFFNPYFSRTENNWLWSVGPQLNYVRGPPPT